MTDHVTSHDDLDSMFAAMRRAEEAANAQVTEAQKEIGWGDFWWSFRPDFDDLFIFGECWTLERNESSEKGAGADNDEWEWTKERLLDSHKRGYRFGMASSVIVPEGEPGSTHIAHMAFRLSKGQFERAREAGWYVRAHCLRGVKDRDRLEHRKCEGEGCACPCHGGLS